MKREDIGMIVALAGLGFNAHEIYRLIKISHQLRRLNTRACNGEGWSGEGWTEGDGLTYDRKVDKLVNEAKNMVHEVIGLTKMHVYHQSDPRGCALYLVPASVVKDHPIDAVYTRGYPVF